MIFQAELITIDSDKGPVQILFSRLCLQSANPLEELKNGIFNKMYLYRYWINEAYISRLYEGSIPEGYTFDESVLLYGDDIAEYYLGYLEFDPDQKTCRLPLEQTEHSLILELAAEAVFNPEKVTITVAVLKATKPSDLKVTLISNDDIES